MNQFMSNELIYLNSSDRFISNRQGFLLVFFLCFIVIPVFNANSVDPDQTPHSAASDLGVHCFKRVQKMSRKNHTRRIPFICICLTEIAFLRAKYCCSSFNFFYHLRNIRYTILEVCYFSIYLLFLKKKKSLTNIERKSVNKL